MKSRRWHYGRMRGGTLLGIALGLCVGVLISFGVVWYLNKTPLPFVEKVTNPEMKPADGQPKPLPGKPGDQPIGQTGEKRFDFYEILEGKKDAASPDAPAPVAAPAPAGRTFLQLGAFQQQADAENLRGRLAIFGYEANVQAVDVPDKGRLYRVRIGPYANPEEMNRVRDQLSQNGIPATVVRD